MEKLLVFLVTATLCAYFTTCQEKGNYDYDDFMEVDMEDVENVRQDVRDLEERLNEKISGTQRSSENRIRNVEKSMKRRISRVQRTIRERVEHLVSERLQEELVEVLKTNKFTYLLNNELVNRARRLQHQLMQTKGHVTDLKKEVSENREKIKLLESELKKDTKYTRLEEKLAEMEEGFGDRLENCCQQVMELLSNCSQSEVSGQSVSKDPDTVTSVRPRSSTTLGLNSSLSPTTPHPETSTTQKEVTVREKTSTAALLTSVRTKLVAVSRDTGTFWELGLSDKQKRKMIKKPGRITDVIYHPTYNRIIWSSHSEPPGVFYFNVDSPSMTYNITTLPSWKIAIDVSRDYIFFVSYSHPYTLNVITNSSSNSRTLLTWPNDLYDITVDTRLSLIYTCDGDKIVELSYDGKSQRTFSVGGIPGRLSFNTDNSLLYVHNLDYNGIRTWNSSSGEVKDVARLGHSVYGMEYYDGKLYLGGRDSVINVVDVATGEETELGNIDGDRVSICLKP